VESRPDSAAGSEAGGGKPPKQQGELP